MTDVEVKIDTSQFEKELSDYLIENAEIIARQIAADAKATTAFKDDTGELRKSIKARKSKFEDGGWIVKAGSKKAYHAWLVEHGSQKMSAKPYLRPALEKNIGFAKQKFGVK